MLRLVADGMSNRQIATNLFPAESIVKGHVSSAFTNLGARSSDEATDLILESARKLGPEAELPIADDTTEGRGR